jgi:hypothetical protein
MAFPFFGSAVTVGLKIVDAIQSPILSDEIMNGGLRRGHNMSFP